MDKIQILQDKVLIDDKKVNSRKFFSKLEKNLYGANNNVIEKENSNSIVSFNELKIRYEGHEYDVEIAEFKGRKNYEKRLSILAKLSEVLKRDNADFSNLSLKEQKYCFKVLRKAKIKEREYLPNLGIDLLYALKQLFTEGLYALVAPPFAGFIFMLISCFIEPKVLLHWDKMIIGLAIGGVVSKLSFEFFSARYQTYQVDKSCIMHINEIKEELKKQFKEEKIKRLSIESNVLQNKNNEEIDFYETHKHINKKFKKMKLMKPLLKKHKESIEVEKEVQPKDIEKLDLATEIFKLINDKLEAGATLQETEKEVLKLVKGFLEEHKDILEESKEIQTNDVNDKEHVKTY